MKKLLVILALAIATGWAIVAVIAGNVRRGEIAGEWPMGLGRLESVPQRYPVRGLREPMPDVRAHVQRGKRLATTGSWDDLREAWEVSRLLWKRPDIISAVGALAIDREIVDAAERMPGPEPTWFAEVRTFDYRRATMAAIQVEAWTFHVTMKDIADGDDEGANWLRRTLDRTLYAPYLEISRADALTFQRETAHALARIERCEFDTRKFSEARAAAMPWWNIVAQTGTPNFATVWKKAVCLSADVSAAR